LPVRVTVQVVVPLQAPPQALSTCPAAGVAVNVTAVPLGNDALQTLVVPPQSTPAGVLVTLPLPEMVTCSFGNSGGVTGLEASPLQPVRRMRRKRAVIPANARES